MSDDNTDWSASLPDALKSAPFFKAGDDGALPSLEQVVSGINNAAQHMGNSIRIPGVDAGDDDIAAFQAKAIEKIPGLMATPNIDDDDVMAGIYGKLGRPEAAKDYTAPEVEGHSWEGIDLAKIQDRAHKLGMSQRQFNTMLTEMATDTVEAGEANTSAREAALGELKTEWGAAFDERVAAVKDMLTGEGVPPDMLAAMEAGELPTSMMKWVYSLAESIGGEGGETSGHTKDGEATVTPEEASAQIDEIMKRPEYWDASSPQQKSLKAKVLKLAALADPTAQTDMNHLRA